MTTQIKVYKPTTTDKIKAIKDMVKLGLVIFGAIFVAVSIFSVYTGNVHGQTQMMALLNDTDSFPIQNANVSAFDEQSRSNFIDFYYQWVENKILQTEGHMIDEYIIKVTQEIYGEI